MNAISKNVVMGVLFSVALLPILSCSLSPSDETGSVAVAIVIPKSIEGASLPAALRESFAPRASSRFIHPGTRLVEVVVAVNGGRQQLRAEARVGDGDASASVTVRGVPYGTHELTVSLYGPDGALLSRGTTSVAVDGRAPASATVSAIPITERGFLPGPFEVRRTIIPREDYGSLCVYRVLIPNAGSYGLKIIDTLFKGSLGFDILALYDANGQAIPFSSFGTYIAYAWIPAGDCYVVVEAPSAPTGELHLSLDADLRITMSAPTLSVNPGLTVLDRMRPFSIRIPCGYGGTPVLDFGGAAGSGATISYPDALTVNVVPGTMGLSPYSSNAPGSSISFRDALLGFERSDVSFVFPGAPRTFIYDPAVKPSDSSATTRTSVGDAITDVNNMRETTQVVVALQDGKTYSEASVFSVSRGLLLLGGFLPEGGRNEGGVSTIILPTNRYAISISADGTHFDRLNLVFPGGNITLGGYPFTSSERTLLKNCSIGFSGPITFQSDSYLEYSLLFTSTSDFSIDGCAIVGPLLTITGDSRSTSDSFVVNAVQYMNTSGALRISNSVIHPGTLQSSTNAQSITMQGINLPSLTTGSCAIAGSTVSSGLLSGSYSGTLYMRSVNMAPSTGNYLNVANSLLVMGNFDNAYSSFLYSSNTIVPHLNNLALGYTAEPGGLSFIIQFGTGNRISYEDWPSSDYRANPILSWKALSLASVDQANPDFLKPRASSPASLRTGGADLSVPATRSALYVSTIEPTYIVRDKAGKERTGDGKTGYTIGAYELD